MQFLNLVDERYIPINGFTPLPNLSLVLANMVVAALECDNRIGADGLGN